MTFMATRTHQGRASGFSRLLLALIGLCGSREVLCAELNLGEFTLEIPAAFQGPMTRQLMAGIVQHLYTVPGRSPPAPTIAVAIFEQPSVAPADVPLSKLLEVSRMHVNKMLGSGARSHADFHAEEPREVTIAGYPAIEVGWSGKKNGVGGDARMFGLTTRKATYLLQVNGPAGSSPEVQAAIKAFKGLRGIP